jgi:capsular exopolysaccharide synthesis family protein
LAQYELNVIDYWLIVRKRRLLILGVVGLVVGLTVLFSEFLKPAPIYEASSRVKFDRTNTMAQQLMEWMSFSAGNDLSSQTEFIRSLPVMERVAVEIGLVEADASAETKLTASYLNVVYDLTQKIKTQREGDTNIIRITASADEASLAAKIANMTATAYRAENIAARNRLVTESKRFVEEQLDALEARLNASEDALRALKEREGQVFLEEEAKAALDTFTKLQDQYDTVLRQKDEVTKQIAVLSRHGSESAPLQERVFTEEPGTVLSILNTKLMDLMQERATLLMNYTTEHPMAREAQRKIDNAKAEMIHELTFKISTYTGREAALKGQIDRYRSQYLAFPKAAIHLSRLERDVKVNGDLLANLKAKHQELLIKSAAQIEEVAVIAQAVMPGAPINAPNTELNLIIGALMGMCLGVVLAFARESFDTSIGTIEGIEEFLKVPVLGVVPQFEHKELEELARAAVPRGTPEATIESLSRLVSLVAPTSVIAESLRSLRTNIQFASLDTHLKSVMFTSAGLGEGKSTCIVNLAIMMAQEGQRVLLIDADLRKPIIHQRLGLERSPGLVDALKGGGSWRSYVRSATDLMLGQLGADRVLRTPGLDNLHVLTSGTEAKSPNEFLNLDKIKALLAQMRDEYDVVLLDAPPILPVTDAVAFSSCVDGTIVVYQVGRIGRNALKRAKFLLEHAQARVLGVVLTNVRAEVTPEYSLYRYESR